MRNPCSARRTLSMFLLEAEFGRVDANHDQVLPGISVAQARMSGRVRSQLMHV